jgi:hypothetical protein
MAEIEFAKTFDWQDITIPETTILNNEGPAGNYPVGKYNKARLRFLSKDFAGPGKVTIEAVVVGRPGDIMNVDGKEFTVKRDGVPVLKLRCENCSLGNAKVQAILGLLGLE